MKIKRIRIENFRSIKHAEFFLSDFNIFIGQNNCGKTNFFEAIDWFFNNLKKGASFKDIHYKKNIDNIIKVEIEFDNALSGAELMKNPSNKTKIKTLLGEFDSVTIIKDSVTSKRVMIVNNKEVNPGTGFDAALNDFLPKFEYVSTKQYYDSVAKYSRTTPIGIMLSDVLNEILKENKQYQKFQEQFIELFEDDDSEIKAQFDDIGGKVQIYLEKQFPDCSKVSFEVSAPVFDELLKNFETTVDDGIETSAEDKGDGMQRALMLAIIQAYADFRKKRDDNGRTFLFFIDEAELHLHPTAQRKLKIVLHALSDTIDQVFITTHSAVLVVDEHENQSIFKVEKTEGVTEIELIVENEKPYVVYELMGGSPSDLLLPKNFLIVEGISEFELFTRVINRFYPTKPKIQILVACGDIDQAERSINSIDKIFSPLNQSIYKEKLVIFIDKPSDEKKEGVAEFLRKNPHLQYSNQFQLHPFTNIEQYYPNQPDATYINWKKTLEEVKAMNGHKKKQLAKHVGNKITQEQFEDELPLCYQALNNCWKLAFD